MSLNLCLNVKLNSAVSFSSRISEYFCVITSLMCKFFFGFFHVLFSSLVPRHSHVSYVFVYHVTSTRVSEIWESSCNMEIVCVCCISFPLISRICLDRITFMS
uniref:Uncharacterized protein n=1 Tax=Cacopsylla melanoneura TaxID=428564 RepID=A0A8D8LKR0_9HEMI